MVHIRQSPNDKREYRYECGWGGVLIVCLFARAASSCSTINNFSRLITLKNGLKALIVRESKEPHDDDDESESESDREVVKNIQVNDDDADGSESEEGSSVESKKKGKQMV